VNTFEEPIGSKRPVHLSVCFRTTAIARPINIRRDPHGFGERVLLGSDSRLPGLSPRANPSE
jgi:hypothetical protein